MMLRKLLAALALTATLAGCATAPPNPLKPAQRDALFVKDATVAWSVEDGERAAKPEYVAGKEDLVKRLEAAVEQQFQTSPAGSEAVVFKVDVKNYSRVGAAMGNLIGGSNMVVADVQVLRERDGALLATYPAVMGQHASNHGVIGLVAQAVTKPDVVGIMANTFAANLRKRWEAKK